MSNRHSWENGRKYPFLWAIIYGAVLVIFTVYVLLDTFVIERVYTKQIGKTDVTNAVTYTETGTVQTENEKTDEVESTGITDTDHESSESQKAIETAFTKPAQPRVTDTSYNDGNISITLKTYREYDTNVYVADVVLSDASYLKTALAKGLYGKNVKQTTSETADNVGALLAVNGDFYGARTKGYVIRGGVLYRDTASSEEQEDLVIYGDGSIDIVTEGDVSANSLLDAGAEEVLSFGPGLVKDGKVTVSEGDEVKQSMTDNPRTSIGIISPLHYVFVVSDGRTDENVGLTLYQLALFMQDLGATDAYNLDGGGSSTMVFMGKVVNNPTTNGNKITEREVSDIVYIG